MDKGGDVVEKGNKFPFSSSSRDRRSLPLRLAPQAREGAIAIRGSGSGIEAAVKRQLVFPVSDT